MFGPRPELTAIAIALPVNERAKRANIQNAGAVGAIVMLALASYFILDRSLQVAHTSADAIAFTQRQQMVSARIAALSGQYAIGTPGARQGLSAAVDAFADSERRIASGDAGIGLTPAAGNSHLKALYFSGKSGLDATANAFALQASRTAKLGPSDPSLRSRAAAIFAASDGSLARGLDQAVRIRESSAQGELLVLRILGLATTLALLATTFVQTLAIVAPMVRRAARLAHDAAELTRLATLDPLTGMLNKRSFQDRGAIELQKAKRYNRPLSILMIDPDNFELVGRNHGQDGAESVLKALTATLFDGTRTTDLVGRVGGEEFAILLPETDPAGAELLAERLRRRICDLEVPVKNATISCTVSIGVAAAEKDASFFWSTFDRAGEALYEAQMRGRNRVFVNAA